MPSRSKRTTGKRIASIVSTAYDLAVLVPGVAAQPVAVSCSATDPRCPMYGDVDGDGRPDRVSVKRLSACRFMLVVKTARGVVEAPLRPPCSKPSEVWPSGFPRVIALRPMNRARGLEPEVLMWRGASNSGLRFFTTRGRRLVPMRIEPESGSDNEWNVGGFADAFSLHDCLRPHIVGVWGASLHQTGMVDLRRDLRGRRVAFRANRVPHASRGPPRGADTALAVRPRRRVRALRRRRARAAVTQ